MHNDLLPPPDVIPNTGAIDPVTIQTGKDFRPWLLGLVTIAFGLFFLFVNQLPLPFHNWTLSQQYSLLAFWVITILYYVVFAVFSHRLHDFNVRFKAAEGQVMRTRLQVRLYQTLASLAVTIIVSLRFHALIRLNWSNFTILAEVINGTWILLFILARIVILISKRKRREQNS